VRSDAADDFDFLLPLESRELVRREDGGTSPVRKVLHMVLALESAFRENPEARLGHVGALRRRGERGAMEGIKLFDDVDAKCAELCSKCVDSWERSIGRKRGEE
jgi:hypothetical protein